MLTRQQFSTRAQSKSVGVPTKREARLLGKVWWFGALQKQKVNILPKMRHASGCSQNILSETGRSFAVPICAYLGPLISWAHRWAHGAIGRLVGGPE